MKLRVLIVDDEPPARKKVRYFLQDLDEVEVVGEARDGLEAVSAVEKLKPDLIFLDIQMPRMDGFEFLQSLGDRRPQIVFTTAYDQYALQAFEVRALDYLLKPFDEDRFHEALQRALRMRGSLEEKQRMDDLLQELRSGQKYLRRILLRESGRIFFVKVDEIDWIEAEEKYVRLHSGKRSYLHRETMNRMEQQLDPSRFARIHRSQIVNVDSIKELQTWSHGDYLVVLKDGTRLPLGRSYREKFLRAFEKGT